MDQPLDSTRPVARSEVDRLLSVARRLDIDVDILLDRTGVSAEYADLAAGRCDSLSRASHAALYRAAVLEIEAIATRGSGRSPISAEDYALMWQSAISCRSLRAVIERIASFSRMLEGRMGAVGYRLKDDTARFSLDAMRTRRKPASFVAELIGMTMFVRMFSWFVGEELPVRELVFDYGRNYAQFLDLGLNDCAVRLGGQSTYFDFPARYLDRAVVRTADELDALLPLSSATVSGQPNAGPYTRRILHLIDDAVVRQSPIPDMTALGEALRGSAPSLRRWLEEEGTSLRAIKRERRRDWAITLLKRPGSTIAQVAEQLGFSDESAFRRAFKAWVGVAPSSFQTAPSARRRYIRN
jgi:AraC-like DNA-binding protein